MLPDSELKTLELFSPVLFSRRTCLTIWVIDRAGVPQADLAALIPYNVLQCNTTKQRPHRAQQESKDFT